MRIILDVNHPGDVHFIKNLYWELTSKGHDVLVVASKKPMTYELLHEYEIPFKAIGSYGSTNLSKAFNLLWLNLRMLFICLKFKPEVMLGTVAFRIAHIGRLLGITSFCFDDTEHATEQTRLIIPFAKYFVTPINYKIDAGEKHIRYEGYHELAYLHPNRFKRNVGVQKRLNIEKGDVYTVVRFVAWNATHDHGAEGVSSENKVKAIRQFLKFGKVFITSENQLPEELNSYVIAIPPGEIHGLIAGATLVFGESSTMSSEAACLGVPAVFIDDFGRCYTNEQDEQYGLVFNFKIKEQELAIERAIEILDGEIDEEVFIEGQKKLLKEKIDVTQFQLDLLLGERMV